MKGVFQGTGDEIRPFAQLPERTSSEKRMANFRDLLSKENPTGIEVGKALIEDSCRVVLGKNRIFTDEEAATLFQSIPVDSKDRQRLNLYIGAFSAAQRVNATATGCRAQALTLAYQLSGICGMEQKQILKAATDLGEEESRNLSFFNPKGIEIRKEIAQGKKPPQKFNALYLTFTHIELIRILLQRISGANTFIYALAKLTGTKTLDTVFSVSEKEFISEICTPKFSVFCDEYKLTDIRKAFPNLYTEDSLIGGFIEGNDTGSKLALLYLKLTEYKRKIPRGSMPKDAQYSDLLWNEFISFWQYPNLEEEVKIY